LSFANATAATAAGKRLEGALATRGRERDLVLGLATKLFPGLALVLVLARVLGLGGGGAVDVHIYQDTVSP